MFSQGDLPDFGKVFATMYFMAVVGMISFVALIVVLVYTAWKHLSITVH